MNELNTYDLTILIIVNIIDTICSTMKSKKRTRWEVQSSGSSWRRLMVTKCVVISGISSGSEDPNKMVMFLSATNCPWNIDDAMRRQFENRIYIPLPSLSDRIAILFLNLSGVTLAEDVDIEAYAALMDGYSGSNIRIVCRDAAMMEIRRKIGDLTVGEIKIISKDECLNVPMVMDDLHSAIKNVNKTVSSAELVKFKNWINEYGSCRFII
ncbi:katanin p60 ATPase-containing subunit A1-like [Octopus sinensis]|uniref:Katanin p60 ATPase-containing subunit A1-like n=1 Tax=Octopus sinensis TaxID=2607531 RepID=A0A7E6EL51_9MOLL|nr:katanin p60 ATPase-containing subunit A1-like [Octopus sinensis]